MKFQNEENKRMLEVLVEILPLRLRCDNTDVRLAGSISFPFSLYLLGTLKLILLSAVLDNLLVELRLLLPFVTPAISLGITFRCAYPTIRLACWAP